jgi:hypothetical protein
MATRKANAIALAVANYAKVVEEAFDTTYCSGCLNRHDPQYCPHRGWITEDGVIEYDDDCKICANWGCEACV